MQKRYIIPTINDLQYLNMWLEIVDVISVLFSRLCMFYVFSFILVLFLFPFVGSCTQICFSWMIIKIILKSNRSCKQLYSTIFFFNNSFAFTVFVVVVVIAVVSLFKKFGRIDLNNFLYMAISNNSHLRETASLSFVTIG